MKEAQRLRRYTYLPYLIDVLQRKRLTFLDPSTWDDKNDAYFMRLYKERQHLQSLLALCFTDHHEKYEIWKVFAGDTSGVSIEFHMQRLLECLGKDPRISWREVEKPALKELKSKDDKYVGTLPFAKRWGFRGIWEYRAIYENKRRKLTTYYVAIDLDCIVAIRFNPWLPQAVFESNKLIISNIDGCEDLDIRRSDLLESERWRAEGDRIANLPRDEPTS